MELGDIKNKMTTIEKQFDGYGAELPGQIQSQIQEAWSPMLKESLGVTRNLMGDYLGRFFDNTQMGTGMQGTTARDLSPTQKLGVMGRELGHMAGDLQATQRYSDYLGGQMNDMYGKALQASQLGYQTLSDEYSRAMQEYQMAWQEAEAEKNRALQRELSGGSGGGGFGLNLGDYFTPGGDQVADPFAESRQKVVQGQNFVNQLQKMANSFAQIRKTTPSGSYVLNGQKLGSSNNVHKYLMDMATRQGIDINPDWLWRQMGNT